MRDALRLGPRKAVAVMPDPEEKRRKAERERERRRRRRERRRQVCAWSRNIHRVLGGAAVALGVGQLLLLLRWDGQCSCTSTCVLWELLDLIQHAPTCSPPRPAFPPSSPLLASSRASTLFPPLST